MVASKAPTRTACDRCYRLKEKCTRASSKTECMRCNRLNLTCTTIRPLKAAGRRPHPHHRKQPLSRNSTTSKSSNTVTCENDITYWLEDVPDLDSDEKELLIFLLGQPQNLDCYVVSSSFQVAEQQSLVAPLQTALPLLKDAYLACASALKLLTPSTSISSEVEKDTALRHASSAMTTLMSLPITTLEEANLCLNLGTVLVLYVYSAVGVGMGDICHYCLTSTNSLLSTSNPSSETQSWQSFLVLQELMDCIVQRKKPTLRLQLQNLDTVDRHLGLCLPLLPYYYDLCEISYHIRNTSTNICMSQIQKNLSEIHTAIEEWQPSHGNLTPSFSASEIINLLAQAKVYRLAALLVSHRLRYVFGQQDAQADIWAKEIMNELTLAYKITKQPIRCVTLPFGVAAVEIRGWEKRQEVLGNVNVFVDQYTPVVQEAMRGFLERVWEERDRGVTGCWFDSVHKPCVVLDSIEGVCFG